MNSVGVDYSLLYLQDFVDSLVNWSTNREISRRTSRYANKASRLTGFPTICFDPIQVYALMERLEEYLTHKKYGYSFLQDQSLLTPFGGPIRIESIDEILSISNKQANADDALKAALPASLAQAWDRCKGDEATFMRSPEVSAYFGFNEASK